MNRRRQAVTRERIYEVRRGAVELLRVAKQSMSYWDLARLTGLGVTVLSRYVKGHVLPSYGRALRLWKTLDPVAGLQATLVRAVKTEPVVDLQPVIGDPNVLALAARDCLARYAGYRVTKIVTVAVNGVPVAAAVAQAMQVPMAIARSSRPVDGGELLETPYARNGEHAEYLYLPARSVSHLDSVLIVDDMVRTGRSVRAVMRLLEQAGKNGRSPELAGVYALIGYAEAVRRLRAGGVRVECGLEVLSEAA